MATTAAERKAQERQRKKEQGMVLKQIWLLPKTVSIIEEYKERNSDKDCKVSDEDAINELIKKALN
jgi:hypothetical protein